MDGSISTNMVGFVILVLAVGSIVLGFMMPKLKTVMVEKADKEELDSAMKEIYALAENDDYLVRRALRETVDPETGKSTVEEVKKWLEKRNETNSD